MAVDKLIFKDAEVAKAAIMVTQKQEIEKLYEDWADEIGERAKYYSHKLNASAPVSERYYKELQKQLRATSQEVSNEVYKKIKSNIYKISDAVVSDNVEWLKSFGFSSNGLNAAFSYVPHEIVQNLITGQIYDSGWSLSSKIWGDNEQTLKDIYHVMARGIAENKSIYEIAKDLESYVRPSENLPWNLRMGDGKKIYKKQVDYNAQRLARTLVQHGYQQSFIATTQKNPFITEYVWRSNGSRACELCLSRDGVHYKKTELPMDHPNGMCTMEPFIADDMIDQLANWFNSPDGTYPEIDKFAGNFGYEVNKIGTVKEFIDKYGMSTKSPTAWYNSLTQIQKAEAKALKDSSGLTWNQWYEKNIHDIGDASLNFVSKYGTSSKSPTAWFNSLSPDIKAEAKLAKESTGLTWNKWYEKYILESGKVEKVDDAATVVKGAFDAAKKKVDDISSKVYSGIWKDDVTPADYIEKKAKIQAKKKYYEEQIAKYSSDAYSNSKFAEDEIIKMKKFLSDLDDFEKQGKLYIKAKKELDNAKDMYYSVFGKPEKFSTDMYTSDAYKAAYKFKSGSEADKFHRPYLDSIWDNETEYEKYSIWEYTQNSNPINKSLSGYHDSWSRSSFIGVGKADLGHEDKWRSIPDKFKKYGKDGHCDYKSVVQNLTTAIEKSEMPESVYVVRGSDKGGFAGLLEGDFLSFDDAMNLIKSGDQDNLRNTLVGQTFTSHSYMSTGITKGTGFGGDVSYEIYCPAGTKGIYAEPTSYFGNTISGANLYKKGQSYNGISGEAEVILQRGSQYRITDVKVSGSKLNVKMEVVGQPDYFKTGLEQTIDGGKTQFKK